MSSSAVRMRIALCLLAPVVVALAAAPAPLTAAGSAAARVAEQALPTTPIVNMKVGAPPDLWAPPIHVVVGPGSGSHGQIARWFRRNGVDPLSVDFVGMPFPDQLLAMSNRAIESSIQTEPLLTAGFARGVHHLLATQ